MGLEQRKVQLDEKLTAATVKAAEAQRQADLAKKMHADSEELADRAEELRHNGCAQRAELLRRANETLRKQLCCIEEEGVRIEERIQKARQNGVATENNSAGGGRGRGGHMGGGRTAT